MVRYHGEPYEGSDDEANDIRQSERPVKQHVADPEHSLYVYRFKPLRVVDADTLVGRLDLGFHVFIEEFVRLLDVDAFEVSGSQAHPEGRWAAVFAAMWLRRNEQNFAEMRARHSTDALYAFKLVETRPYLEEWLYLDSVKYDNRGKYGRTLGLIYRKDDPVTLGQALINAGFQKQ